MGSVIIAERETVRARKSRRLHPRVLIINRGTVAATSFKVDE